MLVVDEDISRRPLTFGLLITVWLTCVPETAPRGKATPDVHEPGPEEVFVVSGVFNDGVRDYPAGSFIHAPAGSSHVPQSRTGCVLFVFYPEG
ncbi:MAG: hypothetical protein QOH49_1533 [Acidobacteriota bacterium]|jgi:anti-sigma factor ChrR (cupin superfamily)|nr:hypothetical protein [Acidobacteriota bacterium]